MRRAIEGTQNAGIEVDVWKIEGVDEQADAAMLAEQARSGPGPRGRHVRAARPRRVDREGGAVAPQASPVEGFIGFAIGRSIWWDALKGYLGNELERDAAADADRQELPAFHQGLRAPDSSLTRPLPTST